MTSDELNIVSKYIARSINTVVLVESLHPLAGARH